jgi:Na+/phosphate symporter
MKSDPVVETLEGMRADSVVMCQRVLEMLRLTRSGFIALDHDSLAAAEHIGGEIHRHEKALLKRLAPTSPRGYAAVADQEHIFVPMHLERVGDNLESLVAAIRKKMIHEGVLFTPRARQEIVGLFDLAAEELECLRDAILTDNRTLIRHVIDQAKRYEEQANDYAMFHEQRLIEGICVPKASSVYLAMLDYLRGVESHVRQIALKISARLFA